MCARLALAIAATGLAMLACSATAQAAFPGPNGQIVYKDGGPDDGLRTVSPDGTGDRQIVFGSAFAPQWSPDGRRIAHHTAIPSNIYVVQVDGSASTAVIGDARGAAWSPGGEKIAFARSVAGVSRLFVANADGSGDTEILGLAGHIGNPAWSPDGSKIAFSLNHAGGPTQLDLYTVNPDGTGVATIASGPLQEDLPSWSPDGSKIAFTRYSFLDNSTVWTMNADGTGQVQIAPCCAWAPAWSPDGTKIAFRDNNFDPNLRVMDADGSNPTSLNVGGDTPDWQPNLWPGHARPKGATPVRVALVPTYHGCAASNEQHGPPLAFPSCNPPFQQSTTLTVGTPDANGFTANSDSSARLATLVGALGPPDEADVAVTAGVTDVRCRASNAACPGGAGSDYAGSLLLVVSLRITDKLNGTGLNESATLSQQNLVKAAFPCTPTVDPATGSDCALFTTADALVPGMVPEGKRTIWQLGQVEVYDSGPNGTGYASCPPTCGNGDETQFMRQGIFVP